MYKVKEIIQIAENLAPEELAYDWDNVGLQIGDPDNTVHNVLITLDITEQVIDEALSKNCQMIIAHHPLIFNPLKRIHLNEAKGKIIYKILNSNLNIFIMHTNLDIANGGMNDYLSEILKLEQVDNLDCSIDKKLYKLVTYIPAASFEKVKEAVFNSGAGYIGNYSHTSFSSKGKGSFKPLAGTKPYMGEENKIQEVEEIRFETILTENQIASVVKQLKMVHPYEEVAYDIIQLNNRYESFGLGRIGKTRVEIELLQFIEFLRKELELSAIKYIGEDKRIIRKIALCTGSGADLIPLASKKGADVYISSDIKYHQGQLAEELGLALIDVGHYHSEVIVKKLLCDFFQANINDIIFYISELNTNPWNYN